MISVEDALTSILSRLEPTPREWVSLARARGRVLGAPLVSRRTQPPADVSAMDGYAVWSGDTTGREREVAGESAAGHPSAVVIGPGRALRIFTGALMPEGADAVVMQEDVEVLGDGRVRVPAEIAAQAYVRRRGLDFTVGDEVLPAGTALAPRHVALAAAVDAPWLSVHRRPRVAVLATGDELTRPGEPSTPDQIVASSSHALLAYVEAWGGEAIDLGIAGDDRASLSSLASGARGADLLVTTGGVSVGDHDLVRAVLGEQGLSLDFWKVAMRPGKPLAFGRVLGTPFLGLPGNPVSSLVCAALFLRPALYKLAGRTRWTAPLGRARLSAALPANDGRQDYLRGQLEVRDGEWVATPYSLQDSSMLATFARAEALVVRRPRAPAAAAGEWVEVLPLGEDG